MTNSLDKLPEAVTRQLLVTAAKKGAATQGYSLSPKPGLRGRSSVWNITKDGKTELASIRTTRDRWFAFQPLEGGAKWKTLDDVKTVIVAAVDDKVSPKNVEIYIFPANEVRKRFNDAYAARIEHGHTIREGYGLWIALYQDDRDDFGAGSGIINHYKPVAVYPIHDLLAVNPSEKSAVENINQEATQAAFATIAEVVAWSRDRIALIAGVPKEVVRLDLKIEIKN